MTSHLDCPACLRIASGATGVGEWPRFFIADLLETVVYLHEHQRYEGWCVLFLKDHVEHLADLPLERQARIFAEVALVAAAIRQVVQPRRINYECLGNQLAHVHWHVIPRYEAGRDPDPTETVWVRPPAERNARVDPKRAADLIERIRGELRGHRTVRVHSGHEAPLSSGRRPDRK